MAPQRATSADLSSPFFCFVFSVCSYSNPITITREELFNIRQFTPDSFSTSFTKGKVFGDLNWRNSSSLWDMETGAACQCAREALRVGILNCASIDSLGESPLLAVQNGRVASPQWDERGLCKSCRPLFH